MERRLTKSLEDKIASLDISKPYVWQLRLSETDFKELEVCLWAISSADGVSALARQGERFDHYCLYGRVVQAQIPGWEQK